MGNSGTKSRRIAAVTGTRADYGLLKPILKLLSRDPRAHLQIIATGTHLDRRFGFTLREIAEDGFKADERVPLPLRGDEPGDIARAMAAAVKGFSRAYERLSPDLLLVLGDRYEILCAAAAALPFRIPVAHIHGGEATEGVIDEQVRHAVTKLSHLHFPVTETYRRRILRMGEDPARVHCFGAPGLDLEGFPFWPRKELLTELRLPAGRDLGVVTYHPATLHPGAAERESQALVQALERTPDVYWVLTLPNHDTGFAPVIRHIEEFTQRRPGNAAAFASLGRTRYLSLLRQAKVMVGNSSSGILEAPSFRLPAVNIGDRQKGRLRAANVIDVPNPTPLAVARAIRRALSPRFAESLGGLRNPYAGRRTCERIAEILAATPLENLVQKRFCSP